MFKSEFILSMRGYNIKTFSKDLMSGLLVAIVALPLSIAFGIQSGLTLQQGIITAIVSGFFISLLGGSKYQVGGPTVTFVALCFGYISDPSIGILGMQVSVFFAGIILMLMGIFRLGNIVKYIPSSVVIGFTAANGVMLLVGQLKDFLGISIPPNTSAEVIPKLITLFNNIISINFPTVAVGIFAIALIYLLPKLNKNIPAVFVSLILVTALTAILSAFDENAYGVLTIGSTYGEVKASIQFPNFARLASLNYLHLIAPAFIMALLATMEGLLSATVADGLTGTKHNSNQELFGLGIANMASALFGGLPATGVLARTATNINSGGKTPMVGILHSLILLIMFLLLMPLVNFIPLTVLAAILISVSIKLINIKRLASVVSFNFKDSFVFVITFIVCIIVSLIVGVATGIVLCVLLSLYDIIKKKFSTRIELDKTITITPIANDDIDYSDTIILDLSSGFNSAIQTNDTDSILPLYDTSSDTNLADYATLDTVNIDFSAEEIIASEEIKANEQIAIDTKMLSGKELKLVSQHTHKHTIREVERIHLSGHLNFINAVKLAKCIESDLTHHSVIIMDMANVTGIDLSALEKLESIQNHCFRINKRIIYHNANERINKQLNKKH